MAYTIMKRIITNGKAAGNLDVEATRAKLDTFYAFGSLNDEQYAELVSMLGGTVA